MLRAHGVEPERTRRGGPITAACRAKLAAIDLNVHDLRHECASRLYFDEGWTLYDVSILLGHTDVNRRRSPVSQVKRLHLSDRATLRIRSSSSSLNTTVCGHTFQ